MNKQALRTSITRDQIIYRLPVIQTSSPVHGISHGLRGCKKSQADPMSPSNRESHGPCG